jgi:hypothetical protein
VVVHRDLGGEGDGGDVGNGGELVGNGLLQSQDALGFLVGNGGFGNVDPEVLDRGGVGESRGDVRQRVKGADHEAGTDEQQKSECDLNDDQRLAGALTFAALAEGASAFAQAGADVDARVIGGLGVSAFLIRLVKSMLYGLRPGDPLSLGASVLFLMTMALIAGWIPATRASRVQPMEALRHE